MALLALLMAAPACRLPLGWLLAAVSTLRWLPAASDRFVAAVDGADHDDGDDDRQKSSC
ncbi:hypothetical protein [Streptomyces sp. CB02959]|uniref:hypothetical protein n=1 Tax=Streptomyces sp. CB02959 TaxID=2020330 RepID=UPI0015E0F34D|nr:hypothetical protein [Streptomyces sp. CB02959]